MWINTFVSKKINSFTLGIYNKKTSNETQILELFWGILPY